MTISNQACIIIIILDFKDSTCFMLFRVSRLIFTLTYYIHMWGIQICVLKQDQLENKYLFKIICTCFFQLSLKQNVQSEPNQSIWYYCNLNRNNLIPNSTTTSRVRSTAKIAADRPDLTTVDNFWLGWRCCHYRPFPSIMAAIMCSYNYRQGGKKVGLGSCQNTVRSGNIAVMHCCNAVMQMVNEGIPSLFFISALGQW